MNNSIPFLDLITPHQELKNELTEVFLKALSTAGFIGGPMVEQFERDFAAFCDTEHCVGVSNGTDALRFAFIAAGIGPGDTVITVPNTFIATTEAISQAGALPAFVDIDERTYNMDPEKLREYLEVECYFDAGKLRSRKTGRPVTAVVPVHLYGQTADMDPILELAQRYNLVVIEDACQAHGAEYFSRKENRWKKAGSMGVAAAFSFYPGKNLGACGEAGAVTTKDAEMARKMRVLRDHGQSKKYYHDVEGYNGRLDAIQAGLLSVKLKQLPTWTELRRAAALRYRELLTSSDTGITAPYEPNWARAVYHLFVVRTESRSDLMKHLADAGIGTAIHYPIPLHMQNAYQHLGIESGAYPVAEKVAPEIVSMPMFPGLTADQQSRVVEELVEVCRLSKQNAGDSRIAGIKIGAAMNTNRQKVVVLGLGEVGKPLFELASKFHDTVGVDISPVGPVGEVDVMHVCFPFQIKDFVGECARYVDLFRPALTVVNSTVTIGTTRAIAERTGTDVVNSPIRGKHARMLDEIGIYTKFVGAMNHDAGRRAAEHFQSLGMKTKILSSPEATELAKLTETTYFGLMIAWAQEVERYCDETGQDYDEVVSFYEEIKFFPSVKYFPGVIGGHCVMPNIEILRKRYRSALLEAIQDSNSMKLERECSRAVSTAAV